MLRYFRYSGSRNHLIVDATEWRWRMKDWPEYEHYKYVRCREAERILRELARRDRQLLHRVYRAFVDPQPSQGLLDEVLFERLLRGLGSDAPLREGNAPPRFARFYVLSEVRPKGARPSFVVPDPWKEHTEIIEAARAAPPAWVGVETVDPEGKPVAGVRCEILLADGDVRTVRTDAHGKVRLEPVPQGQCHIRLPELDESAWKPESGASTSAVDKRHATFHTVRAGECMSRICRSHGIRDWRKVWDDPANEKLREKRPNPSVLFPGDEIVLPVRKVHETVVSTDAVHRIVVQYEEPLPRARWSS